MHIVSLPEVDNPCYTDAWDLQSPDDVDGSASAESIASCPCSVCSGTRRGWLADWVQSSRRAAPSSERLVAGWRRSRCAACEAVSRSARSVCASSSGRNPCETAIGRRAWSPGSLSTHCRRCYCSDWKTDHNRLYCRTLQAIKHDKVLITVHWVHHTQRTNDQCNFTSTLINFSSLATQLWRWNCINLIRIMNFMNVIGKEHKVQRIKFHA